MYHRKKLSEEEYKSILGYYYEVLYKIVYFYNSSQNSYFYTDVYNSMYGFSNPYESCVVIFTWIQIYFWDEIVLYNNHTKYYATTGMEYTEIYEKIDDSLNEEK